VLLGAEDALSFHVGSAVRLLEQWWGQIVDIDFRFLEVADFTEEADIRGYPRADRSEPP
jgi:hypothetical protein